MGLNARMRLTARRARAFGHREDDEGRAIGLGRGEYDPLGGVAEDGGHLPGAEALDDVGVGLDRDVGDAERLQGLADRAPDTAEPAHDDVAVEPLSRWPTQRSPVLVTRRPEPPRDEPDERGVDQDRHQ